MVRQRERGTTVLDLANITTLQIGGTAVTSTAAELNILDGVTATAAELNAAADLSAQGALPKVLKISISSTPTGSEQDSGSDLPDKGIVLDCFVDVTTAEATGTTKTLDVGLLSSESGGDADGFIDGIDVSSTGIKKATLASAGQTVGALLYADEDGAGALVPEAHGLNGTAKSVSFTSGSADFAEFRGAIYIVYVEVG